MNYKQFVDKVNKFRVDAGINAHCDRCSAVYPSESYPYGNPNPNLLIRPRPCELDYDFNGYFWNIKSLISIMDFCEGIIEDVVGGEFATKYFKLHASIRESLFNANIHEQHTHESQETQSWSYSDDAEIDSVFNDSNALMIKNKLTALSDAETLAIGTDIVAIESKFDRIETPNNLKCSPITFHNSDFTPISTVLNSVDSKDITRKCHARYWHMFIRGLKRLDVKNIESDEVSVALEYNDYFKYESTVSFYKTLYLDGTSVMTGNKQYFIDSINAGRNRVLVQDIFFATAIVHDGEIYLDFDVANGAYLVKIKDNYWYNIRIWIVLKELSGIELVYPDRVTMRKNIMLHRSDYQEFQSAVDKICIAVYYWPRSGIVIGPADRQSPHGLKEPKLRFLLVSA